MTTSYAGALILASLAALGAAYLGSQAGDTIKTPDISIPQIPGITPPTPTPSPVEDPLPTPTPTSTPALTDKAALSLEDKHPLTEEEARKKLEGYVSKEGVDAMFKFVKTPVSSWQSVAPTPMRLAFLVAKTMAHPDKCPAVLMKICTLVFDKYSQMKKAARNDPYDASGDQWSEFADLVDELPDAPPPASDPSVPPPPASEPSVPPPPASDPSVPPPPPVVVPVPAPPPPAPPAPPPPADDAEVTRRAKEQARIAEEAKKKAEQEAKEAEDARMKAEAAAAEEKAAEEAKAAQAAKDASDAKRRAELIGTVTTCLKRVDETRDELKRVGYLEECFTNFWSAVTAEKIPFDESSKDLLFRALKPYLWRQSDDAQFSDDEVRKEINRITTPARDVAEVEAQIKKDYAAYRTELTAPKPGNLQLLSEARKIGTDVPETVYDRSKPAQDARERVWGSTKTEPVKVEPLAPGRFVYQAEGFIRNMRKEKATEVEIRKKKEELQRRYERELRALASRGGLSTTMVDQYVEQVKKVLSGAGRRVTQRVVA